jgi:hypothetical protein
MNAVRSGPHKWGHLPRIGAKKYKAKKGILKALASNGFNEGVYEQYFENPLVIVLILLNWYIKNMKLECGGVACGRRSNVFYKKNGSQR